MLSSVDVFYEILNNCWDKLKNWMITKGWMVKLVPIRLFWNLNVWWGCWSCMRKIKCIISAELGTYESTPDLWHLSRQAHDGCRIDPRNVSSTWSQPNHLSGEWMQLIWLFMLRICFVPKDLVWDWMEPDKSPWHCHMLNHWRWGSLVIASIELLIVMSSYIMELCKKKTWFKQLINCPLQSRAQKATPLSHKIQIKNDIIIIAELKT